MFFKKMLYAAGRAFRKGARQQLENASACCNTHIITLGLNEPTTNLVTQVEREIRMGWLTQLATICVVYPMGITIVILLAIIVGREERKEQLPITDAKPPHVLLYMPRLHVADIGGGGGGGGKRSKELPSAGRLPDIKHQQIAPPSVAPPKKEPEIPQPPSLAGAIDATQIPIPALPDVFGDALAPIPNPPSEGEGSPTGIGSGSGTGIGSGEGGGYGAGSSGGTGGGEGGGIGADYGRGRSDTRPVIASRPDPPADTQNRELNRAILKLRGKTMYFALKVTQDGIVEDTHIFSSPGDETFNRLFMEYVKSRWQVYAVRTVRGADGKSHEERVNDWVLIVTGF